MDDHLVFRALSDPTRRLLLDRLFERDGRTLGELCEDVEMTRFGVMKHLRLLEEVGLVVATRSGREKRHHLNPVPIRLIHDRWISKYAVRGVAALAELKTTLEGSDPMSVDVTTKPVQIYQVFIRATPDRIWEAITSPEFTSKYFYGTRVESDLAAGSPIVFRSGSADDVLVDGEVISSDPPRQLVHTWHALYADLAADPPSRVTWELEPVDSSVTKLTVTHDGFESETATFTSVAGGWNLVLDGLKTLLETGTPLQAA